MTKRLKFKSPAIFHVFNKSIANYGIFKDPKNSQRFIEVLDYYNNTNIKKKFSLAKTNKEYLYQNLLLFKKDSLLKFLSFCIMPDHYHLLIKILIDNCLSKYINDVENSFTRYFNTKFNRKGPLWQSRFQAVRIKNNEQLLHVSRYIHLNPTTANLIDKPENWDFSSYKDIITNPKFLGEIFRGKMGQYFTRREIVDFMVKIVDPNVFDYIIDCNSSILLVISSTELASSLAPLDNS